jgi:hypothetical protein
MSRLLKDMAYGLGAKAFKDGKKCIPASDTLFLNIYLKGAQVGEGIPYLKSWIKGWTTENLRGVA